MQNEFSSGLRHLKSLFLLKLRLHMLLGCGSYFLGRKNKLKGPTKNQWGVQKHNLVHKCLTGAQADLKKQLKNYINTITHYVTLIDFYYCAQPQESQVEENVQRHDRVWLETSSLNAKPCQYCHQLCDSVTDLYFDDISTCPIRMHSTHLPDHLSL